MSWYPAAASSRTSARCPPAGGCAPAPGRRDDAVGAEVVAPYIMDTQAFRGSAAPRGCPRPPPRARPGWHRPACRWSASPAAAGELPQQLGAKHQVHIGEGLAQPLGHVGLLPGHAAADADHLPRVAALGVGQGPTLPNTRCSACSRMAQVLITSTRSAPSSVSEKA